MGKFVYREIVPPAKIIWVNSFSDRDGGLTRHPFSTALWPLQMLTEATFTERGGRTIVTVKWLPLDATDDERNPFDSNHDRMRPGWGGTMKQLAAYLAASGRST